MSEARLEKALRESLQREDAPPDFAAKVLSRTVQATPAANLSANPSTNSSAAPKRPQSSLAIMLRRPVTLALAAALAAMAIIPAVVIDYQRREELVRDLKAKQDLMMALAITRDQFRQAKEKVQRTNGNTQ